MSMKPLSAVLNAMTVGDSVNPITAPPQHALTDHDSQMVSLLFEQLKIVFPAWRHAFPSDDSQRRALAEWTRALVDADCTSREQLQLGMRVAREQEIPFFPSTGMFIKWCQITPEALGLPTVDQALADVARHRKSHPAVVIAARATRFERQTLTADEYRKVFAQAYDQVVRRVMAGEDIEAEVLKGLPTREQIRHNPEFYQQAGQRGVARLKALFKRGGGV
ncbi:replication protein P [Aeromonas veronii]|uniref:replication protein P n=1 Tax=Aeromonas veronii TaxID=654 RepID=UPI00224E3F28|nr:replication protein P [Aeromonas veronii]MCX4045677.1 replication protein P [Aeromonas veronii]